MTDVSTGPLTLDDTRAALGDIDPNATNAGALRRLLGRGSLSTIQKHLDTLRAEAAGPEFDLSHVAPDAPKDLVSALWASAWAAAQARTLGALASAQAQLAAQEAALVVAQADAAAAQIEADRDALALQQLLEQQDKQDKDAAQALASIQAQAKAAQEAAVQELKDQQESGKKELAAVHQELVSVRHEKELERAQHAAATALLRGELDRLVNNLADLRAGLAGKLV